MEQLFSRLESMLSICTPYCLIAILGKRRKSVDKGKTFAKLLTDLSNAFDCLPHDLIMKFNSYGFSFPSARLIHSYLSNIKQRTKINSAYSSGKKFSLVSHKVLSLG